MIPSASVCVSRSEFHVRFDKTTKSSEFFLSLSLSFSIIKCDVANDDDDDDDYLNCLASERTSK